MPDGNLSYGMLFYRKMVVEPCPGCWHFGWEGPWVSDALYIELGRCSADLDINPSHPPPKQ